MLKTGLQQDGNARLVICRPCRRFDSLTEHWFRFAARPADELQWHA